MTVTFTRVVGFGNAYRRCLARASELNRKKEERESLNAVLNDLRGDTDDCVAVMTNQHMELPVSNNRFVD